MLEAGDDAVAAGPARFEFLFGEGDRLPDIDALRECSALHAEKRQRKLEARRHDPDNGEIATVQRDFFADEVRIGIEAALPEPRAQDDDAVFAFAKLIAAEDTAFER